MPLSSPSVPAYHLAINNSSPSVKDGWVVDELNVTGLQPSGQVELRALSNGSNSPASADVINQSKPTPLASQSED